MPMRLSTFTDRLDGRLRIADFADLDASPNGLQVGPPSAELEHAAFAVDAARETADRAVDAGADVLVTHHGLIWGGLDRVTGRDYRRLAPLFEHDLALYVAHLPLDAHPELGNAAGLADALEVTDRAPFGAMGAEHLGCRGRLAEPTDPEELADRLAADLDHGGAGVQVLPFGPERIESVAVLTGSGADWLGEAAAADVDAYVTGEGKQQLYHEAKEAGVTVVLAGHYATETFGVKRLQTLAEGWGLATTFIDAPTGL